MRIPPDPLPIAVSGFTTVAADARDPPDSTAEVLAEVGLPSEAVREVLARDAGAGPGLRPE